MITRKKFDFIKKKYGYCASWAVWADVGETPTSNMGDLTVFDIEKNPSLLSILNPNVVLVGLNFSKDVKLETFANFHAGGSAKDFKTRYALKGTDCWGAYMTDILKDYPEMDSTKVDKYLSDNPDFEKQNVESFHQELEDIGSENPKLVAFGDKVYKILIKNFPNYIIVKIPHYSHFINQDDYKDQVLEVLKQN